MTVRVTSETGVAADWQIRVTIPSAAPVQTEARIKVYPNPAADQLYISGMTGTSALRLIDLSGRVLHTLTTASASEVLLLKDYQPGIYLLSVESSARRSVFRVVKK